MGKVQLTSTEVYRIELRSLKARERLLEMRLEYVNKQILAVADLLQEEENNYGKG